MFFYGLQRRVPTSVPENLSEEFGGSPGDKFTLVSGAVEFELAGLAAAVPAGKSCGTVGRPAGDFAHRHLTLEAVGQTNDRHAEVKQVCNQREQRGFLTAMLACGRRKGSADLAVERAAGP